MKRVLSRQRQAGALLLTVGLLLAVIAALAFSLNRAAGMDVQSVAADYDRRSAAYLAEAALAAAKWTNEATKCGVATPISGLALAGATLNATVKMAPSKKINVVASAVTAGGAGATLARNEVVIINIAGSESKDLGGGPRDTYIGYGGLTPVVLSDSLTLASGLLPSYALLYWPTSDIPKDAEVLSARLLLTQNGSSSVARTVNVHRMTSAWDNSATWFQSRSALLSATSWTTNGGDYSAPVLTSTGVSAAGTYSWDVTGLVDGWYSGRLQNYGLMLRLNDPGQSATFYSLEAASSQRPVLRVTFAKQC